MPDERLGEIIETNSYRIAAESGDLNRPPDLGSLVKARVGARTIYAVVCFGRTAGVEGRRAVSRGSDEVQNEAIYEENVHLDLVLTTEFTAYLVGAKENGRLQRHLPASPPPLHYSVYTCTDEEVVSFTQDLDYLRTLLLAKDLPLPASEIVAAHLRYVYRERGEDREWLVAAGRRVAELLKFDYENLMAILMGIAPEER